jgi:hypothetical protein
MSADLDHVVLTLQRGERGELRVSRATFQGSKPFTKLQLWYPEGDEPDAELKPGKCVTLKDHELAQVIRTLIKIDKKQLAEKLGEAPPARRTQHRTISASDQLEEDRKLF